MAACLEVCVDMGGWYAVHSWPDLVGYTVCTPGLI